MPSPLVAHARQGAREELLETPRARTTQNTPTRNPGFAALKESNLNNATPLRDKMAKWQTLAAENPSEEAPRGMRPREYSPELRKPQISSYKPPPQISLAKPRATDELEHSPTRKPAKQNKVDPDVRAASMPKKRLVSDEHWKKSRSSPNDSPQNGRIVMPKAGTTQKVFDIGVLARPGADGCDAWVRPKTSPVKKWQTLEGTQDEPKQRSHPDEKEQPRKTHIARTADDLPDKKGPSEVHNNPAHRKAKSAGDLGARMAPDHTDDKKNQKNPPANHQMGINKSFKPALEFFAGHMPPGGHARFLREAEKRKDEPKDLMNNTKPVFQPPQQIAGGRIDAWLGSSPDPFVTDYRTLAKGAKAAPSLQDLKNDRNPMRFNEKNSHEEEQVSPRDGRRDSERRKTRHVQKEPNILPEFDHRNLSSAGEDEQSSDASPRRNILKRSRAKRNMQSLRTKNDESSADELQAAPAPSTIFSATSTLHPEDSASVVIPRKTPDYVRALEDLSPRTRPELRLTGIPSASKPSASHALVPANYSGPLVTTTADMKPANAIPDDRSRTSKKPSLKRKLTSHADLMSVLSEPMAETQALKSACSVRSSRAKPGPAAFVGVVSELRTDELKYMRELRTLIDGVVPVLLSCVLSKDNTSAASTLFNPNRTMSNITAPIVNMGVALERLRSCHKRLPLDSVSALVTWASQAHRIYTDYIKVWRMGFQDVVVNLAPAVEEGDTQNTSRSGLAQDAEGYCINDDGQKVDVSYLLKRPLVRIKHLAKMLKNLADTDGDHTVHTWAGKYQDLVLEARNRQNEERARLEDEAAAFVDVTRVRDPSSLASLTGVRISPHNRVKARDIFDLRLLHSSGQRLDCRVELIIREADGSSGDILICEVENLSRWLLLPPLQLTQISARPGAVHGEIVVMIRGHAANGQPWQELLSLQGEDEDAGSEWLKMLPVNPIPPEVRKAAPSLIEARHETATGPCLSVRAPSPIEIDIPIGEQASVVSQQWGVGSADSPVKHGRVPRPTSMPANTRNRSPHNVDDRDPTIGLSTLRTAFTRETGVSQTLRTAPSTPQRLNGDYARMLRYAKNEELSDIGSSHVSSTPSGSPSRVSKASKGFSVWLPHQKEGPRDEDEEDGDLSPPESHAQPFASASRARPRSASPATGQPATPDTSLSPTLSPVKRKDVPSSLNKPAFDRKLDATLPRTPQQSSVQLRGASAPVFTPPSSGPKGHRRSSSPLKHEYDPSMSSEESPDDRDLLDDDDADSISSASSADDIVPSLPPMGLFNRGKKPLDNVRLPSSPTTVAPSHSASQILYRDSLDGIAVTDRKIASIFCWSDKGTWESLYPDECSIIVTAGLIEAFTISNAHSGTASNLPVPASPFYSARPEGVAPLIGLELTPLVPLRRGTAIDISIRSPPTPISTLKATTSNIMFRSRNNLECEHLYNAINHARINNPTYIALQNARPGGNSNWSAYMDGRTSHADRPSWWRLGRRRSSYRATSTRRTSSVAGVTDASSIATMTSALSALKRFSANNRMFNVAKSTVTSHHNIGSGGAHTRSSTTFSSDSGSGSGSGAQIPSGASTPPAGVGVGLDPLQGTPMGIRDNKIRLYVREAAGKWRDMGSARLTIMQPPRPAGAPPPLGPDGRLRQEKRVVILGKTKGETLLDVTAGEGSFERVARTGIAVSVWERLGEVGKSGGVAGVRVRVYMVQMKSEAEAAYTFSLVGRLRF